mgnify:CR=1 FL=1
MKKLKRWIKDIFAVEEMEHLDTGLLMEAFNDPNVRTHWLLSVLNDLQAIHLEVDKRLLTGSEYGISDLCAKRKAYQDILEGILSAKRKVMHDQRPNPRPQVIDLDRVTV